MKKDINLRHLSHVVAVCENNCSVSAAAAQLGMSQSVVSRNIQSLEKFLGGHLFTRRGRRLTHATPLCHALLDRMRDINTRVEDLRQAAYATSERVTKGEIKIACTHLQARYILPRVLKSVNRTHDYIKFTIHQCLPSQINDLLVANQVDIGICSEMLPDEVLMESVEAYSWNRIAVVPREGKYAKKTKFGLRELAVEPTITYVRGITGRNAYDKVFVDAGLYPNIVVAAADSDVVKEFTRQGLGVGVISSVAYLPGEDSDLRPCSLPRQFGVMKARLVFRGDQQFNEIKELFVKVFCREAKQVAKPLKP